MILGLSKEVRHLSDYSFSLFKRKASNKIFSGPFNNFLFSFRVGEICSRCEKEWTQRAHMNLLSVKSHLESENLLYVIVLGLFYPLLQLDR